MTSVQASRESRGRLRNVAWRTHVPLASLAENRNPRFHYDRGRLEIRSPSARHEPTTYRISRMIDALTEERESGSRATRLAAEADGSE